MQRSKHPVTTSKELPRQRTVFFLCLYSEEFGSDVTLGVVVGILHRERREYVASFNEVRTPTGYHTSSVSLELVWQ